MRACASATRSPQKGWRSRSSATTSSPNRKARRAGPQAATAEADAAAAETDSATGTAALEADVVALTDVEVPSGYVVPDARLAVVSIDDVYPRSALKRRARDIDPTRFTFSFAPGDYVVHATHGIALFKEMVRQEVLGMERDYLLLEYAKGDKLYVPVEQLDRVTKYVGPEGSAPQSHSAEHRRLVARDEEGPDRGAKARLRPRRPLRAPSDRRRTRVQARHAVADGDGSGLPVRGDARPARCDRGRQGRHGVRHAHGPPHLR